MLVPKKHRFEGSLKIGIGHIFATGTTSHRGRVFHIAGCRFSSLEAPVSRDWILNPGQPITKRLFQKTRLSTSQCQDQPSWEAVASSEIIPFFADLDVLFIFDIENQRGWFEDFVLKDSNQPIVVDLFALAQFFLPDRSFFSIDELIERCIPDPLWKRSEPRLPYFIRSLRVVLKEVLQVILLAHPTHQHLLLSLLQKATNLRGAPEDFKALTHVAEQAYLLRWSDDLFSVSFKKPQSHPSERINGLEMTKILRAFLPPLKQLDKARSRQSPREQPSPTLAAAGDGSPAKLNSTKPVKSVRQNDIDAAFDKLEKEIPTFNPRESQREFARFCVEALNKGGVYAIEAGTGTGKTLAYLLPACEYIRRNPDHQFVIVTATKNLQNQIVDQELRKLTSGKSLYADLRGAIVKGKANYLCITALADLFEHTFGMDNSSSEGMLAWTYLFLLLIRKGGELEGIPWSLKRRFPVLQEFLEEVNAQMGCVSGICRLGPSCIYPRHIREAVDADIIVTNQHKLATLAEILHEHATACLIDEADQFPENFRSSVELEISDVLIRRRFLYRIIGSSRRPGFASTLQNRFYEDLGYADLDGPRESLERCLQHVEIILSQCAAIDGILDGIRHIPHEKEYRDFRWLNLRPNNAGEQLQIQLGRLSECFDHISLSFESILQSGRYNDLEKIRDEKRRGFLTAEKARVEQLRDFASELKMEAEAIAADYPSPDYVHIFSHQRWGWSVVKVPFNIQRMLDLILLKAFKTTLFTSATLFVDDRLDLFSQELCLEKPFDANLRIRSPFDYDAHVLGVVTTFIRPFRWNDPPAARKNWLDQIARTISSLTVATYGRTLILFTNAFEMRDIFNQVRPVLEKYDIEAFIQEGSSLAEINAFRTTEQSVLFGVDRMWTGVDFPGPTLSQLIIVRLPNPNLNDPLIQHRRDHQGKTFWTSYYHRVTKLKLKQGFGRLIRSEKDRGIFVILDSRVVDDHRMRSIQHELPISLQRFSQKVLQSSQSPIPDLVAQGLKMLNLSREFEERGIDILNL